VTWLLLTGAGLVAETVVIVALGRSVTARDHRDDGPQDRPGPAPAQLPGPASRVLDDRGDRTERRGAVREATG
jgi:hypothetical protein